ncbi:slr1659 superfamily regulator [Leptolyngbya sp. AN02str]|uniref:slr1659 superfamily regulator n=1 Tax=Leptolyngbya sp. AN02str TaxID=3423363 RepID=UPI003D323054
MKIGTDDYQIWHEPENSTVWFRGFLRLDGMAEYQPVMELLLDAAAQASTLTLNLRELEFLNSSGISMLSMFVVKVREQGDLQLILQGSEQVLWQTKSLKNLQRLMPSLTLEFA